MSDISLSQICVPLDSTQACVKLNKYYVARKKLNHSIRGMSWSRHIPGLTPSPGYGTPSLTGRAA